jgi:hypothetical protein
MEKEKAAERRIMFVDEAVFTTVSAVNSAFYRKNLYVVFPKTVALPYR